MTHKNKNLDLSGRLPETDKSGTALIVGPYTIHDFFTIYDPDHVEDGLMELFSFAVGNPEFGPCGPEIQNALSLVRNLASLIYALDKEIQSTEPAGDA